MNEDQLVLKPVAGSGAVVVIDVGSPTATDAALYSHARRRIECTRRVSISRICCVVTCGGPLLSLVVVLSPRTCANTWRGLRCRRTLREMENVLRVS